MRSNGRGPGELWDPAYWTQGKMRWGKEGEVARYLDWTKIVQFTSSSGSEGVILGYVHGSCAPGADKPKW